MQYIQACLLTKQNFFWYLDAGLEHMAARPRGNGTNFDWLRQSCDISAYDFSPERNPEKYGRPMKSAIARGLYPLVDYFHVQAVEHLYRVVRINIVPECTSKGPSHVPVNVCVSPSTSVATSVCTSKPPLSMVSASTSNVAAIRNKVDWWLVHLTRVKIKKIKALRVLVGTAALKRSNREVVS